jgi:hypothetical protein
MVMVGVSWLRIAEHAVGIANFTPNSDGSPDGNSTIFTDGLCRADQQVGISIPQRALAPMQIVQI